MKKYFQIVNRVIFGILILGVLFYSRAPNVFAQAGRPMLDSGDGFGVNPGVRISPTSSVKNLKETEEVLENLKMFELNLSEDEQNRIRLTLTPTPITILPDILRDTPAVNPIIFDRVLDTEIGTLVQKITQNIHTNCTQFGTGIIKKSNNICVDGIIPLIGQNGRKTVQHLKESTNVFKNINSAYHETVQCVGCARAMAEASGYPYSGYGNAVNHIQQAVPGYRYVSNNSLNTRTRSQLRPGTLFISSGGAFGHIGMIVTVNVNSAGEADSFVSQECNWGKPGYFGFGRIIHFDQVSGFQVPQTL